MYLNNYKNTVFILIKKNTNFNENKVKFYDFMILARKIGMKEERIKVIKDWLEPKFARKIWIFLGIVKFYKRIINSFSRYILPLISMFQTAGGNKLSSYAIQNKKSHKVLSIWSSIREKIKNLSFVANSVKFKK